MTEHTGLAPALRREIVDIKINLVGLPPEAANKFPSLSLRESMETPDTLASALPEITTPPVQFTAS